MVAIVNTDENWGIGKNGQLLFPIPDDMKFFRQTTLHKVVVMGRSTLQSFPRGLPLKNRQNIVLSRRQGYAPEGVLVCNTMQQLAACLHGYNPDDVYVIGGESVYSLLLPFCSTALVTRVCAQKPADTFFLNLDALPGWELTVQSDVDVYEGIQYRFCTYQNNMVQSLQNEAEK